MTEAVIVALITGALTLLGTIVTTISTSISNRKKTVEKIDNVEAKLDAHIKKEEWSTAKQRRIRILRFNDDLCNGVNYSENHFEEILDDIDKYEAFCGAHSDYHNNKGTMAMDHIKGEYKKRKETNSFL